MRYWLSFVYMMRSKIRRYARWVIILFSLSAIVSLILHLRMGSRDVPVELLHYQLLLKRGELSSSKCVIPQPNPWDKTILKYYSSPKPISCKQFQPVVTALERGVLKILDKYQESMECRCRTYGHNTGVSDEDVRYSDWVSIDPKKGQKITEDFVEVECFNKGIISNKAYIYHWNQIVPKNVSSVTKRPFASSSVDRPSVIMIGIDSMSRSNFIRTLPKTHNRMQDMGFIDMLGHIKIGDNTFTNWMAILTGKRGVSTREFKAELCEDWNIYFDDFPLIWKNFSEAGYVTFFAEDRPDIGTLNYKGWLKGFKYLPTDHYFRPYWLSIFWSLLYIRSSANCYDGIPNHQLQLGYLEDFLVKYKKTASFAYYWSQDLSHDYLNRAGVADEDFEKFFVRNEKNFENAIVIVFSDHGHRYDAIRETVIGRLEARLPYLSLRFPKEFVSKYPHLKSALIENSKKFTTQFDVYETLIDIVQGNFESKLMKPGKQRAYSLFYETPPVRRCFEAGIPEDYCPCFDELQISEKEGMTAANELLDYINHLLKGEVGKPEDNKVEDGFVCSSLKMDRVEFASVRLPPSAIIKDPQANREVASDGIELRYRISLRAKKPSGALLEGVVIKDLVTGTWKATGEIERNNKYGNTSHCVVNPVLKKICYCVPLKR